MESAEDMSHRSVAAIQHHVRVADWREIAGAVYQQHGHMQVRFEQTMNQSTGEIALPRVNENAADQVVRHHDGSGAAAVVNGSDNVGLKTEREGRSGEQFAIGAVKQNGLLRSHDSQLPNAWSSWT